MPRRGLFALLSRLRHKLATAIWLLSVMGAPEHCSIATSRDCRSIGGTTSRRQAVETGSRSTLSHENSWFMGGTRSMPQAKKARRPQQQRVELGASIRTIVEKIRARLPRPSCAAAGTSRNIDWKASLGAEWRQYEAIFPALATSRIDQVSVECAGAKVPIDLLGLLKGKEVLLGAIDVASERVETPEEVAATIEQASRFVPVERLYPCTNCGMAPMDRSLAISKLVALSAGAALARGRFGSQHR